MQIFRIESIISYEEYRNLLRYDLNWSAVEISEFFESGRKLQRDLIKTFEDREKCFKIVSKLELKTYKELNSIYEVAENESASLLLHFVQIELLKRQLKKDSKTAK